MKPYRYRQCPKCQVVLPAGKFGNTEWGAAKQDGLFGRSCPKCHWCGQTWEFLIVLEEHKFPDGTIVRRM